MTAVPDIPEAAVEAAARAAFACEWLTMPQIKWDDVREDHDYWLKAARAALTAAAPEIARAAKVEALSDAMDVASGPAGTPEAIYEGIAALYTEATE